MSRPFGDAGREHFSASSVFPDDEAVRLPRRLGQKSNWTPTVRARIAISLFLLAMSAPVRGEEADGKVELQGLVESLSDLHLQQFELEAEQRVHELAGKLRRSPGASAGPTPSLPATILPVVREALSSSAANRRAALEKAAGQAREHRRTVETTWRRVFAADLEFAERRFAVERAIGMPIDAPRTRTLRNEYLLPIVGGTLLVLFVSLLATLHETRQPIRRRLRSLAFARARVVLPLLCCPFLSGCGGAASGVVDEAGWRSARAGELRTRVRELEADVERQRSAVETLAARESAARAPWTPEADANDADTRLLEDFASWEREANGLVHRLLVDTEVAGAMEADAAARLDSLGERERRVREFVERHQTDTTALTAQASGVALAGLFVGLLPLGIARGVTLAHRRKESSRCPRCLASGKLKDEVTKEEKAVLDIVDNKTITPDFPEKKVIHCLECGFLFRYAWRNVTRESFPTVGVRGSGKTHWIATCYEALIGGTGGRCLRWVKSDRNTHDHFTDVIKHLRRGEGKGTSHEKPHPILAQVRDRDWLYPGSEAITMLFDFAGEMVGETADISDELRQRALLMQGFTFFVDPTQLVSDPGVYVDGRWVKPPRQSLLDQLDALQSYQRDLKAARGIKDPAAAIDVPIAICVPKLDLLDKYNPIGSQAQVLRERLRKTQDRPVDLALIQERSDVLAEYMPVLFPGANIVDIVREEFGERFMLFPLTPVNLREQEIANPPADPSKRTVEPFGIMEPLLWLLHMRGYCTFGK